MSLNVMAFIPARGGSKGVPRKNILPVGGKPLIAWTIEAALRAPGIDRVVVSTDDEEIAAVARTYGADVPFLRPATIAGDKALLQDALQFTWDGLKERGYQAHAVACMYPTSPFRSQTMVNRLVQRTIEGYNVTTVKPASWAAGPLYSPNGDGRSYPLHNGDPQCYYHQLGLFLSINYNVPVQCPVWVEKITDPASMVDIDTWEDVALAETIFTGKLFHFS